MRNRAPQRSVCHQTPGCRLTFDDAFAEKYGKSFLLGVPGSRMPVPGRRVAQPELHF